MDFPKKEVFIPIARSLSPNSPLLPTAISYKSSIQRDVMSQLSREEMMDIALSRKNENVIKKLIHLGYLKYSAHRTTENLYCASIAVATIIKEYDFGMEYLEGDGLYVLARRVYDDK